MVQKKKNEKPKSAKDIKKEIEDKSFGMKNKKKSREIKKQFDKIQTSQAIEKKKKQQQEDENKIILIQPKAPIGTDPKTIPCVYFLNKMCTKGDKCKYGHEKQTVVVETAISEENKSKLVCRFLIDAINEGQLVTNWKCPDLRCKDIHKLSEAGNIEISLEEFIELKRQTLSDEPFLTEESFKAWKEKKKKEDEIHKKKVKAMKEGLTGSDLFKANPDLFVDDEEALECDYKERNYENEEDEIEEKLNELQIS